MRSSQRTPNNIEHTVFLRLGSSLSNPAYNTVFRPKFKASFSSKPNQIPTLGIRIAPDLEKIGFERNTVSRLSVPDTDPWLLRRPVIDFTLNSSDKAITPPEVFKVRFYELCDRFKNFFIIFTPMFLKWATEFRQPCAINAVRQLFGCPVQQASSMRNFTLSCLQWMLSEDLKKNTFCCCQIPTQVSLRWEVITLTTTQFIGLIILKDIQLAQTLVKQSYSSGSPVMWGSLETRELIG